MTLRTLALTMLLLLLVPLAAPAQCYSHYSYPTYSYSQVYQPTYVPVAVAYPLPVYGSTYAGNDYSVGKELRDLKRELELEKIKQELAALKAPAPAVQPPAYQPAPQLPAPDYGPPAAVPQYPAPQPPAAQQECQTCKPQVPAQAPRAPAYQPQAAPQYAPRTMQRVARTRGQHVGQMACASCHTQGAADDFGGGRAFFSDEVGLNWSLRERQIDRAVAAVQKGSMPPKESGVVLTPADRQALVQHLQSLKQSARLD